MVNRLKVNLERTGKYKVAIAYDGQQGLELSQKLYPNLIISDLMLPKLDGYKICRILKFSSKYKHIPIIIYSGRDSEGDKKVTEACRADAYIVKTMGQDVLMDRIAKIFNTK